MKVILDVPNSIFINFIENAEKSQNVKLDYVRKLIDNIKEYKIESTPSEDDYNLYRWVGALAFDDLMNIIINKKVNKEELKKMMGG